MKAEISLEEMERRVDRELERHPIFCRGKEEFCLKVRTMISQRRILNIWKKITANPLPKTRVFMLSNKQFEKFLDYLDLPRSRALCLTEHGYVVPTNRTCGFVAKLAGIYFVCIRTGQPIDETLNHELRHVASGDPEANTKKVWINNS